MSLPNRWECTKQTKKIDAAPERAHAEFDTDVSAGVKAAFPVNLRALIRRHSRWNSPFGLRQRRSVAAASPEIPDGSLAYSLSKSSVSAPKSELFRYCGYIRFYFI